MCLRIRTHLSDTQDGAAGSVDEGRAVGRERVSEAWPGRDEAPKYYRWWTMGMSYPSSDSQCMGCNRPPWPGRCARQRTPTWLTRRKKSESPVETMSSMRGCARDEANCPRESMRHSWRGGSGWRRGDNSPSPKIESWPLWNNKISNSEEFYLWHQLLVFSWPARCT